MCVHACDAYICGERCQVSTDQLTSVLPTNMIEMMEFSPGGGLSTLARLELTLALNEFIGQCLSLPVSSSVSCHLSLSLQPVTAPVALCPGLMFLRVPALLPLLFPPATPS